jgi:hypothetical protein
MYLLQIILLFIISWSCHCADPQSDKHQRYVKYYNNISTVICNENERDARSTLVQFFKMEFNFTSAEFIENEVNKSVDGWQSKLCLTSASYLIVGLFIFTSSVSLVCMVFTLIAYAVSTFNMKNLNGRCLIIHGTCVLLWYLFMIIRYEMKLSTEYWAAKISCVFIRKYIKCFAIKLY